MTRSRSSSARTPRQTGSRRRRRSRACACSRAIPTAARSSRSRARAAARGCARSRATARRPRPDSRASSASTTPADDDAAAVAATRAARAALLDVVARAPGGALAFGGAGFDWERALPDAPSPFSFVAPRRSTWARRTSRRASTASARSSGSASSRAGSRGCAPPRGGAPPAAPPAVPRSFVADAVRRALPSVVRVEPGGREGAEKAAGIVVAADSESGGVTVVTNAHVVRAGGAGARLLVTFQDGDAIDATVAGLSPELDVAVLSVPSKRLDDGGSGAGVAALGDSDAVALGDWCVTIGHPAELDNVVTLGIVSAVRTRDDVLRDPTNVPVLDRAPMFFATDALFNKGISGGPLLNAAGEVIGLSTYKREDLNGLGFAIAMNRVRGAVFDLVGVGLGPRI